MDAQRCEPPSELLVRSLQLVPIYSTNQSKCVFISTFVYKLLQFEKTKAFEAFMITWARVMTKAPKARRKEGWRIKRT